MSKLGAQVLNDARQDVKLRQACEWTLFFMLLHMDYRSHEWYQQCVELACQYDMKSYAHYFWWAMRTLAMDEDMTLAGTREYLEWKIDSMQAHHKGKVKP